MVVTFVDLQSTNIYYMPVSKFTPFETEMIQKYFERLPDELDNETYKKIKNQLRSKYHPDKFEKYENETVKEIMQERFRELESLFKKMEEYFEQENQLKSNMVSRATESFLQPEAQYGFDAMRIEIRTSDKELKYHLFGSQLTWLEKGERFKVPGTDAFIIIESDHYGRAIGFMETIKIYLTFTARDSLDAIIEWLHSKLVGKATSLIIEANNIPIDKGSMMQYIKRKSFLQIGNS